MRRIIIISLVLFGVTQLNAQNFEDAFNAFVNRNQQQFNRFADSINRQFAEAMEANMRTFTSEQPKVRAPKPKPVKLPEFKKDDIPDLPIQEPQKPMPEPQQPEPQPTPTEEVPANADEPASLPAERLNWMEFKLFGENIQLYRKPFPEKLSGITAKEVSNFWIQLSECDYGPMLEACRDARANRGFNDWAVYQLVLELARQTYPLQYNEQAVMAVFLPNQLGMEAKVGFGNAHLFCLLAVEQQLYGVSFVDIEENRYYTFEVDPKFAKREGSFSFRTYDVPFPKPTHGLDMNMPQPLKSSEFPNIIDSAINISTNMIELFGTYPQVDITVYANARPSTVFCQSVEQVFQPYLKSKTPLEAVEYLLSYIQYSFEYATDGEQFGYEKPFFCEENYYYPQNDCEDRSVLFSFLVRHLLHLDVVLIDYSGHIATAVHFPTDVKGESVLHNGKCYVICDPTYIGAPVGTEMPGFTAADRTVVPL